MQALQQLLAGFPANTPGIVMVQHMPADFTECVRQPACTTIRGSRWKSLDARQHEPVRPGRGILIPGDFHGVVRRSGTGYRVELVEGPPVCRHRPSVEVLFRSAAQAAGPYAAGVIMTGMGDDGAGGLLEMRESGSLTIAQNEATCIVFGMPREAIRRGAAKLITPLESIARRRVLRGLQCRNRARGIEDARRRTAKRKQRPTRQRARPPLSTFERF